MAGWRRSSSASRCRPRSRIDRRMLKRAAIQGLIIALLIWKASLAAAAVPDGWCVRFTSPVPLFVDNVTVPHAWDVRADWRSEVPRCSAVMTRAYEQIDRFPVWFYNLPPSNWKSPAREDERPPFVTLAVRITGSLRSAADGVSSRRDRRGSGLLRDGRWPSHRRSGVGEGRDAGRGRSRDLAGRTPGRRGLAAGSHLEWRATSGAARWRRCRRHVASTPGCVHGVRGRRRCWCSRCWRRRFCSSCSAFAMPAHWLPSPQQASPRSLSPGAPSSRALCRPLLTFAAALKLDRRLRNLFGAQLLIGVPFLILIAVRGYHDIGRATWYTIGDDWWMFQRYAYRIYLQGFWLEGGEPAFWFQPFYRWIAGALHMVFGDSSVGELFWDGGCALAGALFAFHVTRVAAGFPSRRVRCGAHAGTVHGGPGMVSLRAGPFGNYIGRLDLFRRRCLRSAAVTRPDGSCAAGLCLALGFLTRLNNLPFALAVAAFSLPVRQPVSDWWRWRAWWPRCAGRVLAGTIAALACAIVLFSLRTYYFTGSFNPLAGTQASARSVWQESDAGETPSGERSPTAC